MAKLKLMYDQNIFLRGLPYSSDIFEKFSNLRINRYKSVHLLSGTYIENISLVHCARGEISHLHPSMYTLFFSFYRNNVFFFPAEAKLMFLFSVEFTASAAFVWPYAMNPTATTHGHLVVSPVSLASRDQDGGDGGPSNLTEKWRTVNSLRSSSPIVSSILNCHVTPRLF